MVEPNEAPKIQIDTDWKAEARAEKQRLAEQGQQQAEAPQGAGEQGTGRGGLPPVTFEALISTMATQALFAMGLVPDPRTGQRVQHLDLARHHIDMLSVLEQKTKGNLTDEEEKMLSATLYELRSNYISLGASARGR